MSKPFEPFTTELNYLQVSLLLDTVSYFIDAPKLLSIPSKQGAVAVPLLLPSLQAMLNVLPEEDPTLKSEFSFFFEWVDEAAQTGIVRVELPTGEVVEQATHVPVFAAV